MIRVEGNVVCNLHGAACLLLGEQGKAYALRETLDFSTYSDEKMRKSLKLPATGNCTWGEKRVGRILMMLGPWGNSWQHTMEDLIDAVGLVWDDLVSDPGIRLVLPSSDQRQREDLITLFGTEAAASPAGGNLHGGRGIVVCE